MKRFCLFMVLWSGLAAASDSLPGAKAQVIIGNVQSSAPTYSAGTTQMPWIDTSGRLQVVNSTSAASPNIVQLSDGAATYIGAKTGQLPTGLGQNTMVNSLAVVIASNQSSLPVSFGTATGAATAVGTQTTIASGATSAITCAGSLAATTPTKLYRLRVTGAALARCTARYNNNGGFTNVGVLMTSSTAPNAEISFPAATPAAITSGSTGAQQWEVSCNNFDAASQDFNVDCSYCSAASGC